MIFFVLGTNKGIHPYTNLFPPGEQGIKPIFIGVKDER